MTTPDDSGRSSHAPPPEERADLAASPLAPEGIDALDRLAAIIDAEPFADSRVEFDTEHAERRQAAREKVRQIENALVAAGWQTNGAPPQASAVANLARASHSLAPEGNITVCRIWGEECIGRSHATPPPLPCGHPSDCAWTPDGNWSTIRCRWCDEVRAGIAAGAATAQAQARTPLAAGAASAPEGTMAPPWMSQEECDELAALPSPITDILQSAYKRGYSAGKHNARREAKAAPSRGAPAPLAPEGTRKALYGLLRGMPIDLDQTEAAFIADGLIASGYRTVPPQAASEAMHEIVS